jgi:predicted RNA-binding protein YlxR (DUF448 family)
VSEPVRTCVACRRKAPQSELMRFAAQDGTLVADPSRRLPGRGAYTCRRSDCISRAASEGAFSRRLRAPVQVPDGLNALFEEG